MGCQGTAVTRSRREGRGKGIGKGRGKGSGKGRGKGSGKGRGKGSGRKGQLKGSRESPPPRSLGPPCAHPFSGPIHRSWPSWVRVLENLTTIRTRVQSAAPRSCCGRHGWRGGVGRLAQPRRLPSRSGGRTSVPCVSACSSANRLLPAAPAPVHVSIGGAGERAPAD